MMQADPPTALTCDFYSLSDGYLRAQIKQKRLCFQEKYKARRNRWRHLEYKEHLRFAE